MPSKDFLHPNKLLPHYRIAVEYSDADQIKQTRIPFLKLIHSSKPTAIGQGVLKPSLCLILSGEKKIQIGSDVYKYGPGDFLIATIDMPISGQIAKATRQEPYLGVSIEIEPKEISTILLEAEIPVPTPKGLRPGAFVGTSDSDTRDAFYRLLKLLEKSRASNFLAPRIKQELLYHLLTGENAALFFQNSVSQERDAGVMKALTWLKKNFDQPLNVESLARSANMSVSSLHHKFKAVTTMGPLQYQKRLRLQEARQLLVAGAMDVSEAALKVGYQSHSQFTREYRRLFGNPPSQDILRLNLRNDALQE